MTSNTLADLPFEIIMIILLMLPAESLIRFMCVSKAWFALITSGDFIYKHLKGSASRGNNYILYGPKMMHGLVKSFKLLSCINPGNILKNNISFEFDSDSCVLVSSSWGLVCLTNLHKFGFVIGLWNPCIRMYKRISSSCIHINNSDKKFTFLVLGFGYLSQKNEYKIVRIAYVEKDDSIYESSGGGDDEGGGVGDDVEVVGESGNEDSEIEADTEINDSEIQIHNDNSATEVEVYSLSTNSWKRVEVPHFPWYMCDTFSRAFVNGSVHWMVFNREINEDEPMILSFNLETELFLQIQLPHYDFILAKRAEICTFKGDLSFLAIYPSETNEICSLWVMNEYGVARSWANLLNIDFEGKIHWPFTLVNDEIVFQDENEDLVLYDLNSHETRTFERNVESDDLDLLPITNSLILLEPKINILEKDEPTIASPENKDTAVPSQDILGMNFVDSDATSDEEPNEKGCCSELVCTIT